MVMEDISQLAVFSKHLGLFGMRITKARIVRCRIWWVLNLIRILVLIYFHFSINNPQKSMLLDILKQLLNLISYISILSCLLVSKDIEQLNDFIRNMKTVDNFLWKQGIILSPGWRKLWRMLVWPNDTLVYIISLVYVLQFSPAGVILTVTVVYWPAIELTLFIYQLTGLVGMVGSRMSGTMRLLSSPHLFESALKCYVRLARAADCLEKFLSLQFLLVTATVFLIWVVDLYTAVVDIFSPYNVNALVLLIRALRSTGAILRILSIVTITTRISELDKLVLHITMRREIKFTAFGFFNLDYSLIHGMIGAAATYLVILIQFGETSGPLISSKELTTIITSEDTLTTLPNFITYNSQTSLADNMSTLGFNQKD